MNIGVFCYNFNHWKTQQGIINLCMSKNKPKVIFAADPIELKFYRSKIRITPKDLNLIHPKDIADYFDIDYFVVKHNSKQTNNLVKEYDLDLGIILGARILKPIAYENFKKGVINMHPGILPINRGLDNIKWAIIKNYEQGVTSHLIDRKIDQGYEIIKKTINVYRDDTLLDIHFRIQNLEQELMIESIDFLKNNDVEKLKKIEKGNYYKCVPPEVEKNLMVSFEKYKEQHACDN